LNTQVQELQNAKNDLLTNITELERTIEILKGQNEEQIEKYDVLEHSRMLLEECNQVLKGNITDLKENNRVLKENNTVLRENITELKENSQALNEQLSVLKNLYQATHSSLESIENSASWKITKPIRLILDWLKSIVK
jgi:chromosome segregation ATPase